MDLGGAHADRRPGVLRVELSVGDATMALTVDEIRDAIASLSS